MTILGTGVDIVETARIAGSLARHGDRFLARVFLEGERAYCAKMAVPERCYAARFAAKEAMIKVLGEAVGWRDVEVARTDGPPELRLHGRARARADALGIRRTFLSLSHTADLAIAYVVAES